MTDLSASTADRARAAWQAVLAFGLVLLLLAISACSEEEKAGEVEP